MSVLPPSSSPSPAPLENGSDAGAAPPAGLTRAEHSQGGPEPAREPPSYTADEERELRAGINARTGEEPPIADGYTWRHGRPTFVLSAQFPGGLITGAMDDPPEAPQGAPSSSPNGELVPPASQGPGSARGAAPHPPPGELLMPAALVAAASFGPWDLDKLIAALSGNPRKYPEKKVRSLAMAIRRFGFRVPMLVQFSTGLIIDGHRRRLACLWLRENDRATFDRLGLQRLPVYNADDMTEDEIRAFRLSVNRMAELGEWDEDATVQEVEHAREAGFELGVDAELGFDLAEVDAQLSATEWDFAPTHDVFVVTITGTLPIESDVRRRLAGMADIKIECSSIRQS